MKKLLLLFSFLLLATTSCKPDEIVRPSGVFIEKSPVENRTTINFTSSSRLMVTYFGGVQKEFSYSVGEGVMTLTPINISTYPAKNVFYHYTDPNKFEIGSIYDGALEGEVMVFVRPPTN